MTRTPRSRRKIALAVLGAVLVAVFLPLPSTVRGETALGPHYLVEFVQTRPSLYRRAAAYLEALDSHGSSYRPDVKFRHHRILARADADQGFEVVAERVRHWNYAVSPAGAAVYWIDSQLHVHHAPTGATWSDEDLLHHDPTWVSDRYLLLTMWRTRSQALPDAATGKRTFVRFARPSIELFSTVEMETVPYREELVAEYVLSELQSTDAAAIYRAARLAGELQLESAEPHLRRLLDSGLDTYLMLEALDRIEWGDRGRP